MDEIVQLLLENKLAIGLIEGPARDRGIRAEPFMKDELVLITPPDFEPDRLSRDQFVARGFLCGNMVQALATWSRSLLKRLASNSSLSRM